MSLVAKTVKSVFKLKTRPAAASMLLMKYNKMGSDLRFKSSKCHEVEDCVEPKEKGCAVLSCSTEGLTRKSPCPTSTKASTPGPEKKISSVWDDPECIDCVCPDSSPKFDAYHYQMTDKKTREYQQTWVECPRQKIVKVIKCEFPCEEDPPLPRRPKNCPRPETACSLLSENATECPNSNDSKGACVKVKMPGCCLVRDPPKCSKDVRGPSSCCKAKCPFPSFSECCKPKLRYRHPSECDCVKVRSMCEIQNKRRRIN